MREVVERLRTDGRKALLGLVELDQALEAFLQNLEGITLAFHEVHAMTIDSVGDGGDGGDGDLNTLQDRTGRLDALMGQTLIAFEQLYSGVQSWNIAGARSASSLPNNAKPPAPTD